MDVRLILVLGDTTRNRDCVAYSRPAVTDVPARRGEIFHCPIGGGFGLVAAVAETFIDAHEAVVVLRSPLDLAHQIPLRIAQDPDWVPMQVACGLRGDVVGVFTNEDNWIQVDNWPDVNVEQLQSLVELGLIDRFPAMTIPDLRRADEPLETSVVQFPTNRRRKSPGSR